MAVSSSAGQDVDHYVPRKVCRCGHRRGRWKKEGEWRGAPAPSRPAFYPELRFRTASCFFRTKGVACTASLPIEYYHYLSESFSRRMSRYRGIVWKYVLKPLFEDQRNHASCLRLRSTCLTLRGSTSTMSKCHRHICMSGEYRHFPPSHCSSSSTRKSRSSLMMYKRLSLSRRASPWRSVAACRMRSFQTLSSS